MPEKYELTLRHGSSLDASDVAEISAIAKAQGLTNDEAQSLLANYEQNLIDQSTRYRGELEADAEVGGAKLPETQRLVKRALDRFVPESTAEGKSLRTFLHKSGLGNSLPLVRLLTRIGAAMSEDTPPGGGGPASSGEKDIVELFYGKPK